MGAVLSRRDKVKIAQRFNAGSRGLGGDRVPPGTKELRENHCLDFLSSLMGSRLLALQPTDESVGYFLSPCRAEEYHRRTVSCFTGVVQTSDACRTHLLERGLQSARPGGGMWAGRNKFRAPPSSACLQGHFPPTVSSHQDVGHDQAAREERPPIPGYFDSTA